MLPNPKEEGGKSCSHPKEGEILLPGANHSLRTLFATPLSGHVRRCQRLKEVITAGNMLGVTDEERHMPDDLQVVLLSTGKASSPASTCIYVPFLSAEF